MTQPEPPHRPTPDRTAPEFDADQILGGRYRVISLLGRGGMGVVYKVEQIFLGKELALKTISKAEQSESILRRFQTEARAVFSLHHPNIIAVNDFGVLDDATPFMAMEIIKGDTLGNILKTRTLSVDEAISLFIQICFGLAHAHENGIVHRDVKPNNIMILDDLAWGTEGSIKILDFGIAKLTQHEGGEIQALTRTGEIFGSPFYMSPEQCLGTKIDQRSDIYSLGCVLFEALTGRPPFVGDNAMSTMMMHHTTFAPKLSDVSSNKTFPPALQEIVLTMLAKNPDDRYQNLGLAAHDLAALQRGEKSPISSVVHISRPARPVGLEPGTIKIEKTKFASILVATGLIFSVGTGTITQYIHSIKKATTQIHKSKASDPFAKTNLPDMTNPRGALKYVTDLAVDDDAQENEANKTSEQTTGEKELTFRDALRTNSTVFTASEKPTDKTLELFKGYKNAQFLELTNCNVTDAGFKNLQDSKLLQLILNGDKKVTSVDHISKLRYLQRLALSDTGITDDAMIKLAQLPMLERLELSGCNISEKGLMNLTQSTSLTQVQLSDKKYSREFIGKLQAKLPQCVFKNYFALSNLQAEVEKKKLPPMDSLKLQYSIVSTANPLSRYAAKNSLYQVPLYGALHKPKEIRQLLQKAIAISENRQDWEVLAEALLLEAYYLETYGDKNEGLKVLDKAFKLTLDTSAGNQLGLPSKILQFVIEAKKLGDFQKAIEYGKVGLNILEQWPEQNQDYVPILCELITWTYFELNRPAEGQNYAKRLLEYWQKHQNDNVPPEQQNPFNNYPKLQYVRALVEMGHSTTIPRDQINYYSQALDLMDRYGWPQELNLNEHYCDVCAHMADICNSEGKPKEALKYLYRAQSIVSKMKHEDTNNRKKFFADRIANQLKLIGKEST